MSRVLHPTSKIRRAACVALGVALAAAVPFAASEAAGDSSHNGLLSVEFVSPVRFVEAITCADDPASGNHMYSGVIEVDVVDVMGNPLTGLLKQDVTVTFDPDPGAGLFVESLTTTDEPGVYDLSIGGSWEASDWAARANQYTATVNVLGVTASTSFRVEWIVADGSCPYMNIGPSDRELEWPGTAKLSIVQGVYYGGFMPYVSLYPSFEITAPEGVTVTPDPAYGTSAERPCEYYTDPETGYTDELEATCHYLVTADAPGTYTIAVDPYGTRVAQYVTITFTEPEPVGTATLEMTRPLIFWSQSWCPGDTEPNYGVHDGLLKLTLTGADGQPVTGLSSADIALAFDPDPDGKLWSAGFTETATPGVYSAPVSALGDADVRGYHAIVEVMGLTAKAEIKTTTMDIDRSCPPILTIEAAPETVVFPATSTLVIGQRDTSAGFPTVWYDPTFTIEAPEGITVEVDPNTIIWEDQYCNDPPAPVGESAGDGPDSICVYTITASAPGTYDITIVPNDGTQDPLTVQATFTAPSTGPSLGDILIQMFNRLRTLLQALLSSLR